MRRRHVHEEHANHEAWAIPYGDLLTLLLAFFVVMYAISSLNEGKYRVVADALSTAFGGAPRTINPIQVGQVSLRSAASERPSRVSSRPEAAQLVALPKVRERLARPVIVPNASPSAKGERDQLQALGTRLEAALADLMREKLVRVRRGDRFLEVEIQSDILFVSGSAQLGALASLTVDKIGHVLAAESNSVRVEGYTDDVPISTFQFRSNWELSSARAASVVHRLVGAGVGPARLAVVGFGEHQPIADNGTPEGRNANRRVMLVILAERMGPDSLARSTGGTLPEPDVTGSPERD